MEKVTFLLECQTMRVQDQKNEYRGHTIENTALVSGQLPEHKASTLPDSRKLSNMQSSVPVTSSLPAGTEPHKVLGTQYS